MRSIFYLSKEAARYAYDTHEKLKGLATEFRVDLSRIQNLKKNFRMFLAEEPINNMRTPSSKLHLKELVGSVQKWSGFQRKRDLWSQKEKRNKKKENAGEPNEENNKSDTEAKAYPLREEHGVDTSMCLGVVVIF
ncbi:hypothetical protein NDU88_006281 [Pleurodeles waltl]|uniref:Uncharacterized protein n=1 Tax=Pleurodeles waltl TaxID=8319 RepID=A0AAV7RLF7_PLEWA|nr:hypothetical protein NDU88_006281 [Pleurodeles waltl]